MIIRQQLVSPDKYKLKCPYQMTPVGICVHNTANDASAKNEISYMTSNTLSTSFHIAVDDLEAVQGLPLDRNGWHAGDGANGEGNRKYIGIEICYSKSGGEKFNKAEDNASVIIAQFLKERGWGVEKVKKHKDFSGKYCPHRTLDLGWERFINKIKTNMADIYKGIDLSNRDSVKVAVDTWYEVAMEGKYITKIESEKALTVQREGYEIKLTQANEEIKRLTEQLNQPIPGTGSSTSQLPETITVAGDVYGLQTVNLTTDGKLTGGYTRI